jgi:multiple sugar transport system substrate-binding protein
VTTYMEPESLTAWQTADYAMMRNWTYAYAASQDTPKLKGKFEVLTLPAFEGGEAANILGGHSAVISAFTENPGAALTYLEFTVSPEHQQKIASQASLAPALVESYDDPVVKKALPYSAELKAAIEQAKTRPVSGVYPQISQAIYKNVNAAISGQTEPKAALEQAHSDIEKALATF